MKHKRIHIMGAPGSGVSTLGRQLAIEYACVHFDTDDYYWFTSDPLPYKRKRNPDHRRQLLHTDLSTQNQWILSGSLCGWGDVFIPLFDQVVYLWAPVELRLERIRAREAARYGTERLAPGGDLHQVFEKFIDWAAQYDTSENIRGKSFEINWLSQLSCPVIQPDWQDVMATFR
jgi:adenylate kinase family enzyme